VAASISIALACARHLYLEYQRGHDDDHHRQEDQHLEV
jgi:hypothetical protein